MIRFALKNGRASGVLPSMTTSSQFEVARRDERAQAADVHRPLEVLGGLALGPRFQAGKASEID